MQFYLPDCPVSHCTVFDGKRRTEVSISRLGLSEGTGLVFEATQQRALTEEQVAGERQQQQQQVGWPEVHPA